MGSRERQPLAPAGVQAQRYARKRRRQAVGDVLGTEAKGARGAEP